MRVCADVLNNHLFSSLWGELFTERGAAEMLGVASGRTNSLPTVPPQTDIPVLGGAGGIVKFHMFFKCSSYSSKFYFHKLYEI